MSALKTLFVILVITTLSWPAYSQQKIVGKVMDAVTKQPVKQALVKVEGTETGAITNVMGFFEVKVDTANILTIQHPGYVDGRIKITSFHNIRIPLLKLRDAEKKKKDP